jgi:hypothetical protein
MRNSWFGLRAIVVIGNVSRVSSRRSPHSDKALYGFLEGAGEGFLVHDAVLYRNPNFFRGGRADETQNRGEKGFQLV